MQEPPPITITDPRDPEGSADVLISGDERTPLRLPRRVVVIGMVVTVLVGGTAFGVDRYRDHRAQVRAAAAAFAIADTLHTRVALADEGVLSRVTDFFLNDGVADTGPLPSTSWIVVPLLVTDDPEGFTQVRDIQVTGVGVVADFDLAPLSGRQPGTTARVEVPVRIDCGEVAAGRYPALTAAIVSMVPESGRVHRVSVPVTSKPETALEACRLPDPQAVPRAAVEEQHGRLLVEINGIPWSRLPLKVLGISSPGLRLSIASQPGHAVELAPGINVYYDVDVRVTDCAAARTGGGRVTLQLRSGERRWTIAATDAPANDYRRPGSTWLRKAVERACP